MIHNRIYFSAKLEDIISRATTSSKMDTVTVDEAKLLIEKKLVVQHGRVCDRN